MNKLFSGIMPAMITPFDKNGNLKKSSAEKIMKEELSRGVNGFYVNGATGEGLFLTEKTRIEMAETAVDVCKGKGVIINHVGAVDALSAIRLAKHAAEIGCDAISSLVPNYLTTYTQQQVLDYYKALVDASGLPLLVYCKGNVGGNPVSFMKEVIKIPNVIGCKYTMTNYYDMRRIVELNQGDINVINGPDEMLICGLIMGADGGIGSTYNLMPEWYCELYKEFRAGNIEKAQKMQYRINHVIEVLLKYGCIPSIKATLNIMGYDAGNIAYPGRVLTDEECRMMKEELTNVGYQFWN